MSNESETEAPIDPNLIPSLPMYPTVDSDDDSVADTEYAYSIFNKETDFVVGGPLGEAWTAEALREQRRRWFASWSEAEEWATAFYGPRLKGRKPSEPGDTRQWAFIVRKA